MSNRTCDIDDCRRPHWARGMCSSHYATWHRRTNGRAPGEYFTRTCEICGINWETRRKVARFCSGECKGKHYSQTMRRKSMLPASHPVMVLIAEARRPKPRQTKPAYAWRTERECPGCACWFTPLHTPNAVQTCCQLAPCATAASVQLTLAEWGAWLASRELSARRTSWTPGDPRYTHLTDAALAISPAA